LQSRTPNCCNRTLVKFFFFFICSHRNKPEDFAIKQFRFLQSRTTQDCNHIPNNQLAFFNHTDKVRVSFFVQPHITTVCNQSRQIVAITHWFIFRFLFWSHRNKPAAFCNHSLNFSCN
jgi:hypothetical protein